MCAACTQAHALNLCSQNSAKHGGVLNSFIRFYVVSVRVASLIVPNSLERKAWLALFHRKGKGKWNDLSWKLSWYLTNSVLFQCLDTLMLSLGMVKTKPLKLKNILWKEFYTPNSGIKETESFSLKVAGAREYSRILVNNLYSIFMIGITTQNMRVSLRMWVNREKYHWLSDE